MASSVGTRSHVQWSYEILDRSSNTLILLNEDSFSGRSRTFWIKTTEITQPYTFALSLWMWWKKLPYPFLLENEDFGRGWWIVVLEKWWLSIHKSFEYNKTGCVHGHVASLCVSYVHIVKVHVYGYMCCGNKHDCALVWVSVYICLCIIVCLYCQSGLLWGFPLLLLFQGCL